eukprot:4781794-Karenia_brevis.AAC.1
MARCVAIAHKTVEHMHPISECICYFASTKLYVCDMGHVASRPHGRDTTRLCNIPGSHLVADME